jgi:hypothetical protein
MVATASSADLTSAQQKVLDKMRAKPNGTWHSPRSLGTTQPLMDNLARKRLVTYKLNGHWTSSTGNVYQLLA